MDESSPKISGPLTDAGLLDEAQVYHAMFVASQGSVGPRMVDKMFIWEIASCLGVGDEVGQSTEDAQDGLGGGAVQRRPSSGDRYEYIRARVAHAQGKGPKPEARPMDPEAFQALTSSLRPVGS